MSTIPLAKGFSEKHLKFPVLLSRKFDGVPIRIDIDQDGNHTVRTRQDKAVPSVHNLVQELVDRYLNANYFDVVTPITLIGEVVQSGNWDADFKETSGIVRKQTDQSHRLAIMLFECDVLGGFEVRWQWMEDCLHVLHGRVHVVEQIVVKDVEQLHKHHHDFNLLFPKAEGLVVRNPDDPWAPGKRSWGYQKLLNEPTIDLRIVRVEEATTADGEPKGMVGRLVASYNGTAVGIGPGRLTHAERTELWELYGNLRFCGEEKKWIANGGTWTLYPLGRIAQIKHKGDDSYDALRQPTFQHWRDDKETPDA